MSPNNPIKFTTKMILQENTWTLKLTGDVDARTTRIIRFADISEQLDAANAQCLIIDLDEVELIDSSGLRLLLDAKKELSKRDIEVVLKNPSNHMRRLFRIMQFDQLFKINQLCCVV